MRILSLSRILAQIALRDLWLHKSKTLGMGGILALGTFLIVFGLSVLNDIEESMKNGIIQSVAGHLQLYSKNAKDSLALFGGGFMGREDLGEISDYSKIRPLLLEHPNVAEVIPMGFEMAILGRGNQSDEVFESLREALKSGDQAEINAREEQVKFHLDFLKKEIDQGKKITADPNLLSERSSWIAEATSEAFWENIHLDSEGKLQFLETKIAPLSGEKSPVYLRYLGTDPQLFQKVFKKFKVVSGEMIPEGKRGILISARFRGEFLKIIPARKFDLLYRKKIETGLSIANDAELKRIQGELALQHRLILTNLDFYETKRLKNELSQYFLERKEHGSDASNSLENLLKQFLLVDDDNFLSRYNWFYEHIAPLVRLYEISPGQTIVLRFYSKSGYVKSVPVYVFGVYSFEGLERSDIAGAFNITDLVTFRELYGLMTEEALSELAEMKEAANVREIAKNDIESVLFDETFADSQSSSGLKTRSFADPEIVAGKRLSEDYKPEELQKGLIINTAIFLRDEAKLFDTQRELESTISKLEPVNVVDWQKASGIVGQFIQIIRYVLLFGVSVILLVALIIINNSMIVATFERTQEIGTMRAFGAQKGFIVGLFMTEAFLLSLIASCIGTFLAWSVTLWLRSIGIPAVHDVLVFLFSGSRLFPSVNVMYMIMGPFVVMLLASLSALYPALYAASTSPATAMQEIE